MEVIAVDSAIYGLALSLAVCVCSVAVFTGHLALLAVVVATIVCTICAVVAVFYLAQWEVGAVEAISLSILVGSSVDYCVHLVEGFVLLGRKMPKEWIDAQSPKALRLRRASSAVNHIGVAILCSALTTIIAALPLTQTTIQPFAKFGAILLINTSVSMVMTFTLAVALLATIGPPKFQGSLRAHVKAIVITVLLAGLSLLVLWACTKLGVRIPGPTGGYLFATD